MLSVLRKYTQCAVYNKSSNSERTLLRILCLVNLHSQTQLAQTNGLFEYVRLSEANLIRLLSLEGVGVKR